MGERAGEDALSDNDCVDVADKTSVMQYQTWVHGRYGWPAEAERHAPQLRVTHRGVARIVFEGSIPLHLSFLCRQMSVGMTMTLNSAPQGLTSKPGGTSAKLVL